MKVYIKNIHVEGYGSFQKPVTFNFDRLGVNLIKGENGVGKSTLLDALIWCLYKDSSKKNVATWADKRFDSFKGTRVIVEIFRGETLDNGTGYLLARHLGYKGSTKGMVANDSLMLFSKDNVSYEDVSAKLFTKEDMDGDGLHKKDIQQTINEDVIGIDVKTFKASVFFGQRLKGLVEADSKDTRLLFERLFDLSFVDIAMDNAKSKKIEIETEITKISSSVYSKQSLISSTKSEIERAEDILSNFDKEQKERLSKLEEELNVHISGNKELSALYVVENDKLGKIDLSAYDSKTELLQKTKRSLVQVRGSLEDETDRIVKLKREIVRAESNIKELENSLKCVKENCPTCAKPLDKKEVDKAKKNIAEQISKEEDTLVVLKATLSEIDLTELEAEVKKLTDEVEAISIDLKSFADIISNKNSIEKSVADINVRLATYNANIKSLESSIEAEKSRTKPVVKLDELKSKVTTAENDLADLNVELETIQAKLIDVSWWISTGFASKGMKSFVFNAMLGRLNELCYEYAARLGFYVQFTIDMSKASKPFKTTVYMDKMERDYEDFSGGQKQRVDICIAFAMHSLISSNIDFNILVMDELFEGLDGNGMEVAFDLIRHKAEQGKSVYVITHEDSLDSMYCNHLTVVKDKDGSSIIKV